MKDAIKFGLAVMLGLGGLVLFTFVFFYFANFLFGTVWGIIITAIVIVGVVGGFTHYIVKRWI